LVAFEGDVKLTDFGIAKAKGFLIDNEGEVVAGKADYMSPEQSDFQITDKRSDVFSAGVVLGHLVLGKNVFKGETAEQSRERVLKMAIPNFRSLDERVDERLNQILQRALARKVDERYPNADELLYDLEHYIYHKGYGPTNETLGRFIRELFGQGPAVKGPDTRGSTDLLERTARLAVKS
jgi:serine/threonine-protein kinase